MGVEAAAALEGGAGRVSRRARNGDEGKSRDRRQIEERFADLHDHTNVRPAHLVRE